MADASDELRENPADSPLEPLLLSAAPAVDAGVVEGRARRDDELAPTAVAAIVAWFTEGGGVTSHGSSRGRRLKPKSAEEAGAAGRAASAGKGVSGPAVAVVVVSRVLLLVGWKTYWKGAA